MKSAAAVRTATLTSADYAALERGSWITREIAAAARLYRVSSLDGRDVVGRRGGGNYAGIVFPYIWPGENHASLERLRLDNPPVDPATHKAENKYLQASGTRAKLYLPPCDPALIGDADTGVIITEGEKKALSLWRAAREAGNGTGKPAFLPVAVPGVWGWKGTVGTTTNAQGERVQEKGVISDLERILWTGRRVTILFDANADTNAKVKAARRRLAGELADRGAEVWIASLPAGEGINGVDDFLALHGLPALLEVLTLAKPFDASEELRRHDTTDAGNEECFVLLFGDEFLYNWTSAQWLQWNGVFWQPDRTDKALRGMLEVAEARMLAAFKLPESTPEEKKKRAEAITAVRTLRDVPKRRRALESAQSNPRFARLAEDFNQDDYLLACSNGVIDLRTGRFRPGERGDHLTMHTPVSWNPNANRERFLRFLSDIFPGRAEMWTFLQRAAGYSATGLTREESFFLCHGSGRNGKGTFLGTLSAVFGDYSTNCAFSTLIQRRDDPVRNDLAALCGARFVTAQESRAGMRFDEALIKTLTGGDLITARFLHHEFFTFRPTWKLWLSTNHKPEIRQTDPAIWSRPKLIPFTVSFQGKEDRSLKGDLLTPESLSGILSWIVQGAKDYLEQGLEYPAEVLRATEEYKAECDVVGRFLEERCEQGDYKSDKSYRWQARPLYKAFVKWAEQTGERQITETAFGRDIKARAGIEWKREDAGNRYYGIRLRGEPEEDGTVGF